MLINQLFESNNLQQDKPKTRNPVAKNAPRSGAGQHRDRRRAERHGEVKHKKSATANDEIKESQHRPEQAVMILRRIPEGYRGARLYEKIMNTIIKRLGPAGPGAERREFYQTLAADVMERYIQKFPASAAMKEDRASDDHRKAQVRLSDAIDYMITKLEAAKNYQAAGRGQEAQRCISDAMSEFTDTFDRKISREKYEDFIVPLDWCMDALANETWDGQVVNQTIDISINLLDEINDQIWREIMPAKDDEEGGISIGDLSENYDDDDDEEDQEDAGFFVVIANEDDGVFIGYVTKEDGRWYERRVSGRPPYAWGGPKYMSYLTPRDVMNWIRRDFERHYEVKGPFADEESARDYAEQFLGEGVAESTITESGETYTWTAHFADGTTKQMNIATDEVPYAREAFAMKFPGRDIARVTTDWKVAGGQHAYGAVTAMPDRRPTEPYGRDVDNPMVRESDKDNFTIDDIKHLETINDFATLKAQAKELIKGKSARRMKPEKIAYFYNAVDKKSKPIEIIKLMYDLLLAGEGHQTIGSRHSTNPNTYRQKFGESTLNEAWSLLGQKSKGNLKVKIYKDKAWDRYAVEFYKGSYYDPRENFYTDDKQSAIEEIQRFFSYGRHGIGESSQVHGQETAKKISPVLTRPSKKHPFDGRLVGEDQHHDRKENIESSLVRRIKSKHMDQLTDALQKFGIEHVMQTISNTVDDYASIDELGSSDISIMVKQILKQWSRNVQ